LIEEHVPALAARLVPSDFALLGPMDIVSGAIVPTVRHVSARLGDGRLALAIGDAWIVNDPVLGQGANIGSHCAWAVAQAIAAGPRFDDAFARRIDEDLWAFAGPITALTNAFLQPPPAHVLDLLAAASAHQDIADAFATAFADPVMLAHTLLNPLATAALVRSKQRVAA
jgi:2-polyprenyl-6-methoxyphenol hydroxylase-like FAD-dependent oxidoreductase